MKERLIAIGDIHGEFSKLENLLNKLEIKQNDTLVFLGDYIDRGLQSKKVVDKLLELSKFCHCEFLMGNHEYYLLKTFDGDKNAEYFFLTYGGVQTIESYGSMEKIFEIHGDFFRNLKPYYMTENYFFVHGGIEPAKEIEKQDLFTMLMIREDFINNPVSIDQKVIFGHTPYKKPLIQKDKIGIDTGSGKYPDAYITAFICDDETFVFSK